jgi:hypothetical protein
MGEDMMKGETPTERPSLTNKSTRSAEKTSVNEEEEEEEDGRNIYVYIYINICVYIIMYIS